MAVPRSTSALGTVPRGLWGLGTQFPAHSHSWELVPSSQRFPGPRRALTPSTRETVTNVISSFYAQADNSAVWKIINTARVIYGFFRMLAWQYRINDIAQGILGLHSVALCRYDH